VILVHMVALHWMEVVRSIIAAAGMVVMPAAVVAAAAVGASGLVVWVEWFVMVDMRSVRSWIVVMS